MTIASEIAALETNLQAAKNAVVEKGGSVSDTGLAGLADEIEAIPCAQQKDYGTITYSDSGTIKTAKITSYPGFLFTGGFEVLVMGRTQEAYLPIHAEDETGMDVEIARANIKTYTIGPDVETFPERFLGECTGLETVDITGASDDMIPEYFLYDCKKLTSIVGMPTLVNIPAYFLNKCTLWDEEIDFSNVESIGSNFLSYSGFNHAVTANVTTIENNFLDFCTKFNSPVSLPNVTTIGNEFMRGCSIFNTSLDVSSVETVGTTFMYACSQFNQRFYTPELTTAGSSFLGYCSAFNQPLDLEKVTSINYFLVNCTSYNKPIKFAVLTKNGENFMQNCSSFNSTIDMGSEWTTFTVSGNGFMVGCSAYNRSFTLPATLDLSTLSGGVGAAFNNMKNFIGPLVCNCAPPAKTSNYFCATPTSTDPCYTTGVLLTGPYASSWKSLHPNRTSTPFRKLRT